MQHESTEGMSNESHHQGFKEWTGSENLAKHADGRYDGADHDDTDELQELDRLISYQNFYSTPKQQAIPHGFFSPVRHPAGPDADIPLLDDGDGPPPRGAHRENSFNSAHSSDPRQDDEVIRTVVQRGRQSPSFKRRRDRDSDHADRQTPDSYFAASPYDDSTTDTGATDAFETLNMQDEDEDSSSNPKRVSRVSRACSNCKKSKTKCDAQRPCGRCVRLHKAHTCQDSVHQKRGRKPQPKTDANAKTKPRRPRRHTRHKSMASLPSMTRSVSYDNMTYPPNAISMQNNPAFAAHAHARSTLAFQNALAMSQSHHQMLFGQHPQFQQLQAFPFQNHSTGNTDTAQQVKTEELPAAVPRPLVHSSSAPVMTLNSWNPVPVVAPPPPAAERERERRARRRIRTHHRHRSESSVSLNQVLSTPTKIEYLRALSTEMPANRQIRVMNKPLSIPTRPVETRDKKA